MANEATLLTELQNPISFTVADGTAITKGTLLKMTDPMTAIIASAANDVIAGIAGSDKIASDGITELGVYRKGIFKMALSGSCSVGDPLAATGVYANYVSSVVNTALLSGSTILGTALETGTNNETIKVDLNIQNGT